MERLDLTPTRHHQGYDLRPGKPLPFGARLLPNNAVNFSIFTQHGTSCTLVLFKKGATEPLVEIPFFDDFRIGNSYAMIVFDLDFENIEYGYRVDGPHDTAEGHWFDPSKILLDPYALLISGRNKWGEDFDEDNPYQHRAQILCDDFIWEGNTQLETPIEDLIIYELHTRGFTRHPSSGVKHPGTFAGIVEKIPYLKELGVNCVELMPIHEFDEFENGRTDLEGNKLLNYWGYSNVGFFAPKAGFAASGEQSMQADELKELVKELHKNGIEVILDVVFNHTAEGNEQGPYISYRGIDNKIYYMLTPEGSYYNFSGCGNTLNCNNSVVRGMILDCLRYWAVDYHIDGFRFDLASILGRDPQGAPMSSPPLLEMLAGDPVLGRCKLIAEAWDAGGMYQVGSFPSFGRWAEWNGKYRDDMRRFLKGDAGMNWSIANRIAGSPDLYRAEDRGAMASINFITCHDGFSLNDLVSYNEKHNLANGEENRDGTNDNYSWNCGAEGETDDVEINKLREKLMKNAFALLLLSHGVPMLLAGDEMANTQFGNNNAYCQDNKISWLDWNRIKKNKAIFQFAKKMIAFRKRHPVLRSREHFMHSDYLGIGVSDVSWHGRKAWHFDTSEECRTLAFMFGGEYAKEGSVQDNTLYVATNMHWQMHGFELPAPPKGTRWHIAVNTDKPMGSDIFDEKDEVLLQNQGRILVGARSIVVLVAK